jgi:hypothetical protein
MKYGLLAAIGVMTICGIAAWIGAVPVRLFGLDTFFLLDNGWRALCGQRVHVDYASAWGPITFLVVALGLELSRYTVDGLGYANAIFGAAVGAWGWTLCRHRLTPVAAFLGTLYLSALVVAPYPLGWGFTRTSHAMVYNRYGYALLGLVMIECFVRDRRGSRPGGETLAGFSTGAAIGLLLFLKVSFFLAAGPLLMAGWVLHGVSRRHLVGMLVGFAAVSFANLAYLGFDGGAVLADWTMAAGARTASLSLDALRPKLVRILPFLVLCAWLGWRAGETAGDSSTAGRRRFLFAALAVIMVDTFVLATNQQPGQAPIVALFGLLGGDRALAALRSPGRKDGGKAASWGVVLLTGACLFTFQFGLDLAGLAVGATLKADPGDRSSFDRFAGPRLSTLVFFNEVVEEETGAADAVRYLAEGETLLREHRRAGERVLNLDMSNPFPYLLDESPPRGGMAAAAYRYTLSDDFHPSDDRFFGDADLVTVPKQTLMLSEYFGGFFRIYETALHERYDLVAENDLWFLYRRK